MEDLKQLEATNKRVAARELANLRADTVKELRYALEVGGVDAVIDLLAESGTLCPVFDHLHRIPRCPVDADRQAGDGGAL